MKKKEEKVGGLGGSGAADRCEPASCVHRAASQDEHVADQRTLGALMCKHGVNIDAGSLGITLEPSSRSSALVHISSEAARTSERLSRTSPSVSHSQSQRAGSAAAARPTPPPACYIPP